MGKVILAPLVTADWLARHLGDSDIRIVDATVSLSPPLGLGGSWMVENNRAAHDAVHIPGAQYADLVTKFSAPVGRFSRPDPLLFASSVERLGIGPDTRVVIYDRGSGIWAARLWWVMRSYGLDEASVLDGGFELWTTEPRPTSAQATPRKFAAPFVPQDRLGYFVDKQYVAAVVEQGGACLINALDAQDFHANETNRYARPGRIPGSVNIPASSLVDKRSNRFLSIPALRDRFSEILGRPGRKILYCGGGIAACADVLALTLLGEKDISVYDASLVGGGPLLANGNGDALIYQGRFGSAHSAVRGVN